MELHFTFRPRINRFFFIQVDLKHINDWWALLNNLMTVLPPPYGNNFKKRFCERQHKGPFMTLHPSPPLLQQWFLLLLEEGRDAECADTQGHTILGYPTHVLIYVTSRILSRGRTRTQQSKIPFINPRFLDCYLPAVPEEFQNLSRQRFHVSKAFCDR